MPKYTLGDAVDPGPIPDKTWLEAQIVSIVKEDKKTKEGEPYTKLKWKFVITEPDSPWEGKNLIGRTSEVFEPLPDCKFYNWTQAAMNTELQSGFEVDTDDLWERPVRVQVSSREYDKDGETRYWIEIANVMPPRGTGRAPAAATLGGGSGGGSTPSWDDEEPF